LHGRMDQGRIGAVAIVGCGERSCHDWVTHACLEGLFKPSVTDGRPVGVRKKEDWALEFEEPALLALGSAYQKRPRLSGGAYHPLLLAKRNSSKLSRRCFARATATKSI
jgi:hypothetical protein